MVPQNPRVNDFVLTVRDGKNQVLHKEFVANPLERSMEFVDDAGHLNMKTIQSDSAQFMIRLQLGNGASTIDLEHYLGEASESILLLTSTIQ
ncbi:MAG: hypothetical protein KAT15_04825 [Bacteroidales bacterium]|nr:hypothetical protein [Bacteroidales bacterium]